MRFDLPVSVGVGWEAKEEIGLNTWTWHAIGVRRLELLHPLFVGSARKALAAKQGRYTTRHLEFAGSVSAN